MRSYITDLTEGGCRSSSSRMGAKINAITIHFTKGGNAKATALWAKKAGQGSAHYYVGRAGRIYQIVPDHLRAWHHGKSIFDSLDGGSRYSRTDRSSIGIEIANFGDVKTGYSGILRFNDGMIWHPPGVNPVDIQWELYPEAQVMTVVNLVADLIEKYNIPLHRVIGHEDVASPQGRKHDPGPMWDWGQFMIRVNSALHGPDAGSLPENVWSLHKTVVH